MWWVPWTLPYQLKRIDALILRPSRARVGLPKNGEVITPLKLWKLTLFSRFRARAEIVIRTPVRCP